VVPVTAKSAAPKIGAKSGGESDKPSKADKTEKPAKAEKAKDKKEDTVAGSAQVLSLDSFRKKS
jgi:hypothetical protein